MCCGPVIEWIARSGEAARLREAAGISPAVMAAGMGWGEGSLGLVEAGRRRCPFGAAPGYLRVLLALRNHQVVTGELDAGLWDDVADYEAMLREAA